MVKRNDIKDARGTFRFHLIYLVKHLGNRIARGLRFYIILAGCWLDVTSQEIFLDEIDHSHYLALKEWFCQNFTCHKWRNWSEIKNIDYQKCVTVNFVFVWNIYALQCIVKFYNQWSLKCGIWFHVQKVF